LTDVRRPFDFRFDDEERVYHELLQKIQTLKKYFGDILSQCHLSLNDTSLVTLSSELTSPLYFPVDPLYEQAERPVDLQQDADKLIDASQKSNVAHSTIAIAMRLPRNFTPLALNSTTSNEILHSPHCLDTTIEYKKELPSDIVSKYAGLASKKKPSRTQRQQQNPQPGSPSSSSSSSSYTFVGKKNKKNRHVSDINASCPCIVVDVSTLEFRRETFVSDDQSVQRGAHVERQHRHITIDAHV
jgi:hypothetical protein